MGGRGRNWGENFRRNPLGVSYFPVLSWTDRDQVDTFRDFERGPYLTIPSIGFSWRVASPRLGHLGPE